MKKSAVAAVVTAAALGLGYGVTQFANADDPTPGTAPSVAASANGRIEPGSQGKGMKLGHMKNPNLKGLKGMGNFVSGDLATELGIDEDALRDAARKVAKEQFPDAADRDAFKDMTADERAAEMEKRKDAYLKALAKELGIEEAAITSAVEKLQANHAQDAAARLKTRLDEAVKAGTLTQAEADAVTKAVEKGVIGGR